MKVFQRFTVPVVDHSFALWALEYAVRQLELECASNDEAKLKHADVHLRNTKKVLKWFKDCTIDFGNPANDR